jgi:hypothetical protein
VNQVRIIPIVFRRIEAQNKNHIAIMQACCKKRKPFLDKNFDTCQTITAGIL